MLPPGAGGGVFALTQRPPLSNEGVAVEREILGGRGRPSGLRLAGTPVGFRRAAAMETVERLSAAQTSCLFPRSNLNSEAAA